MLGYLLIYQYINMASTLEEKIQKLTDTIEDLTGVITSMSGEGGALKSDNAEVRSKAEELAMDRMRYEEKLLARKEKNFDKKEKEIEKQEKWEKSFFGRGETFMKTMSSAGSALKSSFSSLWGTVLSVGQEILKAIGGLDKAAVGAYRSIGMSKASMDSLRKHAVETANQFDTINRFGANSAELLELQVSYTKELGRNVSLAGKDLENFAAMKQLVGKEQAIKFTANFEKFGLDVKAASEEMLNLFNESAKSGIVFEKYASNVVSNLQLAQQYTFRDGVDGLMRMAKQSTAIRWNMQQTAAFAEKVSSVEGAITTSAQMSVLGGEFAQFANPMNMLYESLNDMEGLNNRLTKLFSQFASFNEETKQIEVSAFDRMRIKSAAQAMGLDFGQVMDSIFAQGRAKLAEKHLNKSNSNISDEYKEFLKNKAQIDRENGRTYVNLLGKDGKNTKKYLDTTFTDDDKKLMDDNMRTKGEDIKKISGNVQSIDEKIENIKKEVVEKIVKFFEDMGGFDKVKNLIAEKFHTIVKAILIYKGVTTGLKLLTGGITSIIGLMRVIAMTKGSGGGIGGGGGMLSNFFKGNVGGMSPMARMGWGMGLGIAGMGLNIGGAALHANGHHGWGTAASIGGGALSGASMGAMFGLPGMIIGGLLGGAVSGVTELINYRQRKEQEREINERNKLVNTLQKRGLGDIRGEYTNKELMELSNPSKMSNATRGKFLMNNSEDMLPLLYAEGGFPKHPVYDIFKDGGILNGPSHAHGGIALNEKGDVGQGYEAIIPADQTLKNMGAVKSLINGTFNQKYTPMTAEKPMGDILKVSESNNSSQIGVNRIDFSALNMNMGGTLKLELAGNYKDIDARKLLDDTKFTRTLEGMVRENVAVLGNRDKRHALSRYDNPDPNGRHVKWS